MNTTFCNVFCIIELAFLLCENEVSLHYSMLATNMHFAPSHLIFCVFFAFSAEREYIMQRKSISLHA